MEGGVLIPIINNTQHFRRILRCQYSQAHEQIGTWKNRGAPRIHKSSVRSADRKEALLFLFGPSTETKKRRSPLEIRETEEEAIRNGSNGRIARGGERSSEWAMIRDEGLRSNHHKGRWQLMTASPAPKPVIAFSVSYSRILPTRVSHAWLYHRRRHCHRSDGSHVLEAGGYAIGKLLLWSVSPHVYVEIRISKISPDPIVALGSMMEGEDAPTQYGSDDGERSSSSGPVWSINGFGLWEEHPFWAAPMLGGLRATSRIRVC